MWQSIKCFFGLHEYIFVSGSMKLNGEYGLDRAMKLRPEYDAIEKCKCGKAITTQYLSYADKPKGEDKC